MKFGMAMPAERPLMWDTARGPVEAAEDGSLEEVALRGERVGKKAPDAPNENAFGELGATLDADDANEARRVAEETPEIASPSFPLPKKLLKVAGVLAVLLAVPYLFPKPPPPPFVLGQKVEKKVGFLDVMGRFRVFTEGVSLFPDDDDEQGWGKEEKKGAFRFVVASRCLRRRERR